MRDLLLTVRWKVLSDRERDLIPFESSLCMISYRPIGRVVLCDVSHLGPPMAIDHHKELQIQSRGDHASVLAGFVGRGHAHAVGDDLRTAVTSGRGEHDVHAERLRVPNHLNALRENGMTL